VPDIDLPTLKSLLARVEGATGACWSTDNEFEILHDARRLLVPLNNEAEAFHLRFIRLCEARGFTDAALALCERVLPGCTWELSLGRDEDGLYYIANIQSDDYQSYGNGCLRSTSSLTTVAALLKALISQEQSHG
jgi:hypothetical protein